MGTETQTTEPVDAGHGTVGQNGKVSMSHHMLFGLLSLIVLLVGMEAVYLVQQHRVNTLSSQLNNYQSTLVKDSEISLDNLDALTALPNVVVDAANSPTDLIAFLGADNTQCYKGGGSGYYKVLAQANDQSAKMQYGCTAKGGTTPLGSSPSHILAKKTNAKWTLISPTNQWLPINGQDLPSCAMVNNNKISKLVTPQCWQGPASGTPGNNTSSHHTVVQVTNP